MRISPRSTISSNEADLQSHLRRRIAGHRVWGAADLLFRSIGVVVPVARLGGVGRRGLGFERSTRDGRRGVSEGSRRRVLGGGSRWRWYVSKSPVRPVDVGPFAIGDLERGGDGRRHEEGGESDSSGKGLRHGEGTRTMRARRLTSGSSGTNISADHRTRPPREVRASPN